MKISCTNTMVPGASLTEKAKLLADCGYDGISVFEDFGAWTEEKEEELLQLEHNTGMKVCEFCFSGHAYGALMDEDPAVAAASRKIYEAAIKVCNRLGAVSEMEYQYAPQNPVPLLEPYRKMDAAQHQRFCSIYASLAEQVTGGARLLLEPINRYESPYLNNLNDNAEVLSEVNMPRTGILFDTFHVSIEEVDICQAFRMYADRIGHVHLGDNNRLLPGKGNLPWPRFFAIINELGYNGFVNLECAVLGGQVPRQLENTAKFLRSMT